MYFIASNPIETYQLNIVTYDMALKGPIISIIVKDKFTNNSIRMI